MSSGKINFGILEGWSKNYENNAYERETKNVVIYLDDIKNLINYCDQHKESDKINSIRFYLVRQNEFGRDIVFGQQSQISIVGVPVIEYRDNEFDPNGNLIQYAGGYDLKDGNDIYAIYPQSQDHEHSGLCPYNCRGSINKYDAKP